MGTVLLVWLPFVMWWVAFRPGLMSNDTFSAILQAKSGDIVDGTNPPPFTALVWLALKLGGPSLLALGQSLLLASGIVALARATRRAGAPRSAVLIVTAFLAVSPAIGAFSISLWKDIPYAAAMLFLGARYVDLAVAWAAERTPARRTWVGIGAISLTICLLRPNAPLVIALTGGATLLALRRWWRPIVITFAVTAFSFVGVRSVVYPALGVEAVDEAFAASAFVRDIAGVYSEHPETFTRDDLALMASLLPLPNWQSQFFCPSVNTLYNLDPGIDQVRLAEVTDDLMNLWLRLLKHEPALIVRTRLCASTTAWRPWSTKDLDIYTTEWPIPENMIGQRTRPLVGAMHDVYESVLRRSDTVVGETLLWRAPGYLYLLYAGLAIAAVRSRRWLPLLLAALPLAQQLTMMAVSVAPDARYMLVDQMVAVLLLPMAILTFPRLRDGDASGSAPAAQVPFAVEHADVVEPPVPVD